MVDINVLYVGSDYSITHMGANRMEPSGGLNEDLLVFTDESFGMERMVAVLTEAPAISEIADLSFLEQGGVPVEMRGGEKRQLHGHAARYRQCARNPLGDEDWRQGRSKGRRDDFFRPERAACRLTGRLEGDAV